MKRVVLVVGARPNFPKAAPILAAAKGRLDMTLVHTNQHYDPLLSDKIMGDLQMPRVDRFLDVGYSLPVPYHLATIINRFSEALSDNPTDAVMVVGDVTSTLGCALAASMHQSKPKIIHVEAGLRSFDKEMPEERNRVLTDHLSDILFATEDSALKNLENEGISRNSVHLVGNTMIDSLKKHCEGLPGYPPPMLFPVGQGDGITDDTESTQRAIGPYGLLTLHRPSNVDEPETFKRILRGIEPFSLQYPIIFPVHPRTRRKITEFGLNTWFHRDRIRLVEPQGYLDFIRLMKGALLVFTDSGGVQEETSYLRVPCVTLRHNTERPVTQSNGSISNGTNFLAGTSPDAIQARVSYILSHLEEIKNQVALPWYWDGKASERIVGILEQELVCAHS